MPKNQTYDTFVSFSFAKKRPSLCRVWVIARTVCLLAALTAAGPMNGPLRVHPKNPRYFTDNSGKAVYLTGSHHWNNLQDSEKLRKPLTEKFDYEGYLKFLEKFNHNFMRMWSWEDRRE